MARPEQPKPTDAELEILRVIWQRGPSTVRGVYDALAETREIGYTTVLKFMQIMTEKGLLTKDDTVRPQVYTPARSKRHTQRQLLGDLLERAFGGSAGSLAIQALSQRKATPEERKKIRELLDRLEEESS